MLKDLEIILTNFISKVAMEGLKHFHPSHSVEHIHVVMVAVQQQSKKMFPVKKLDLKRSVKSHVYCCKAVECISQPAQMWSKEFAPFLNNDHQ